MTGPCWCASTAAFTCPVLQDVSEDAFGADFLPTEADYTRPGRGAGDPRQGLDDLAGGAVQLRHEREGVWLAAPSPPSWRNLLGTDDQARDVLARVVYGFRLSVLFGFTLTIISSTIGILAGALHLLAGSPICWASASSRSGTACRQL